MGGFCISEEGIHISRSQQGQVFKQSQAEQGQAFGDAENSYTKAQQDIGNYESQLGKYASSNPYTAGGEFQTDTNRVLANTADSSATSAGARLQGIAARTGQNPGGATAATEEMQQANERNLGGQEASAERERIGSEADYNKGVLSATAAPVAMETSIASGQGGMFGHALSAEEEAAKTPSFMETLESQVAATGQAFAEGAGKGMTAGCWVAAELYGGWGDPRTKTLRAWFLGPMKGSILGRLYLRYGERVAKQIRYHLILRRVVRRFFDHLLEQATAWGKA